MGDYYVMDKTPDARLRQLVGDEYHPVMGALVGTEGVLPRSCDGDAFVLRDWLEERGFVWGEHFYVRKRRPDEPV